MTKQPEPLTPLRQAVEDAYRLFKAEPPEHWSGDDIGVGKKYWARLTNVPLRELNLYDTTHFLTETARFDRREVGYMLPRLLEMLAGGDAPNLVAVECSLNCLAAAGYPGDWAEAERELIERSFANLLRAYCADPEAFQPNTIGGDLGGYLCMIGCAGGDIRSALAVLESVPEQQFARVLASWIGPPWNPAVSWRAALNDNFWDLAPVDQGVVILDWLDALDPPGFLEAALSREVDPAWREILSGACEAARCWRPGASPEAPCGTPSG